MLLKTDLQIMTDQLDDYLLFLLETAKSFIQKEGISLEETVDDNALVVMYAAYLYRKRKEQINGMPRMLRYALNNRLLSEKMAGDSSG